MLKFLRKSVYIDLIMISLALASVFILFSEFLLHINIQQEKSVQYIDLGISLIFLADFLFNFFDSKQKLVFFQTHWWELLAAIPITTHATQVFRSFELVRLLPVIPVIRLFRFLIRFKMLLDESYKFTKQTYLMYLLMLVAIIVIVGASVFQFFEYPKNPKVHTFGDSLWWAVVTVTTIGYGDIYPITTGGRMTAIFLMLTGIGALGVFLALIETIVLKQSGIKDLKT